MFYFPFPLNIDFSLSCEFVQLCEKLTDILWHFTGILDLVNDGFEGTKNYSNWNIYKLKLYPKRTYRFGVAELSRAKSIPMPKMTLAERMCALVGA